MDYWLKLPAWRKRLEGEKAAKRYVAEHLEPRIEVPGVLPSVGQTATFIRRMFSGLPNPFAWLNDDLPTPRMPPVISGGTTVPTASAHSPATIGPIATFHHAMRRRRH